MTLTAGTRLGPYEVLAPLGAGGMGEVYRARDTRLEREVAIKVLPAELAADAERLRRFEKEARSASALNHPNIVTIYDIGSEGGVSYIAMERVEGATLRELLAGGAVPIRRLLPIAAQIAEGLAKAHEAGIVHRDLKPENVMVTKDGLVKILDFGLAKLTSTLSGSGEGSNLPTMTGTTPGVVVGTVGYMSPEQASGAALDFRSDQFAFGSILYEMATGKRAFQKKTAIDTLAAILNEEPEPIAALNPQAPLPLRWIAERCLSKEPRQRYASTDDLARDLATVRDRLSEAVTSGGSPVGARSRRSPRTLVLAAMAILLAAVAAMWLWPTKAAPVPRFQQVTFQKANIHLARFAPDGQTIVYSAGRADGRIELLQTRPGSHGSRPLGIFDAQILSISASGEMALAQENEGATVLTLASLGGGEPRVRERDVEDADWAPDGKNLAILRAQAQGHGTRVEFPIGNTLCEKCGGRIRVSPRGDRVAVVGPAPGQLAAVDRSKMMTRLAENAMEFGWAPDGNEVWFTRIANGSTSLFAVTLGGRERMLVSLPGDFTLFDISREGRALFERGFEQWEVLGRFPGDEHEHGYKWLDATLPDDLSADGRTLLFSEKEPGWKNATSYVRKTDGSAAVPLGEGFCRALSPDGKWAVCRSELMAPSLRLQSTSGETRDLPNGGLEYRMGFVVDWLPDGESIVFSAKQPGRPERLFVQSVKGTPPKPVTPEGVSMIGLSRVVSPDGRRVIGLREGVAALYPLDEGEALPIPGLLPGDLPTQWSNDGNTLYLQRDDSPGKIWLLDRSSGQRRLFKDLRPPDTGSRPGIGQLWTRVLLSRDGQSWVRTYSGWLSDLFVLEGLK
jgi:Tol biopolymer transport system component/predicted Ser/Thr protein kinase